ncbi:hypothetical protein Dsin_030664 [Dipteronia sinensis]|uniref:Uncharacterized protein n=1 Tax=Dipteronia sinensis TaxID=43782 RepID=A0AAE0DRD7_9ROSI|nr:hypothetical protein Dsin_030664 [Dipteronia sinensis]
MAVKSMTTPSEAVTRFDKMVSKTKRKYYMLAKKEGIGKTSYAASLRVKFTDSEHPILVVSADPTHSLNNSFAQTEMSQLIDTVINSLYSSKDIFLRELALNTSNTEIFSESNDTKLEIQIKLNKEKKILSIHDRGASVAEFEKDIYEKKKEETHRVLWEESIKKNSTSSSKSVIKGTRIQSSIFGNDIELFKDTLIISRSYRISNAFVKAIRPEHRIVDNDYQWTINGRTLVQEIIEEKLIIPSTFSFVSFADLEKYKDCNAQVDIIALAIDMKPAREIRTRQGLSMIQEIIVINQECCIEVELEDASRLILATLFGKNAENILSCSAKQLMEQTDEDGITDIESVTTLSNPDNFLVHIKATTYERQEQTKNKFSVVAANEIPK